MKKIYRMPETMAMGGIVAQNVLMNSGAVTPGNIQTQTVAPGAEEFVEII